MILKFEAMIYLNVLAFVIFVLPTLDLLRVYHALYCLKLRFDTMLICARPAVLERIDLIWCV